MTMWSLTLPQVAATLAAALVALNTLNPAHQRLIDSDLLHVVLVLMLTTAILGPLLTAQFAPLVSASEFTLYRLEGGKFAEVWDLTDMDAVMRQIGQGEA